ncbi:MAG TPA: NifB/NifX family molybdenum-iron cluster-binding protein, partial [Pseudodesulfovibrio sp.]|nr:NifB/NifX family molybdenum-iron cluster-binding protein [Pseudodesulfovibrio sp.]
LVNQHLGEAKSFQIWGESESGGYRLIEERQAPQSGCGPKRWSELAAVLKDCRAVLCAAVGETPRLLLEEHDIKSYTVDGFIEDALRFVFEGGDINALKVRRAGIGSGCAGGGAGCG